MISLNYRDSRPIYIQIKEEFRRQICTGLIPDGDRLPSVRELAATMAINPNTIQRAYQELEAEGFIYTIPGKGSFAEVHNQVTAEHRELLLHQLQDTCGELLKTGVGQDTILARVKAALSGEVPV